MLGITDAHWNKILHGLSLKFKQSSILSDTRIKHRLFQILAVDSSDVQWRHTNVVETSSTLMVIDVSISDNHMTPSYGDMLSKA